MDVAINNTWQKGHPGQRDLARIIWDSNIPLGHLNDSLAIHQNGRMLKDLAVTNKYTPINKGYSHFFLQDYDFMCINM
jgi:hypothetical protein